MVWNGLIEITLELNGADETLQIQLNEVKMNIVESDGTQHHRI